jgi:drug/metabolite transporter (DMT)-like permease
MEKNQKDNLKKAIIFSLLSALSLSTMSLFVKLASPYTSNSMTIFFRFSISFIYIIVILTYKKLNKKSDTISLKAHNIGLHIIRALIGVLTMMLFYYSLRYISLVNGTLLVMTNPFFIPIIVFIIFRKLAPLKIWLSILLGFVGVALLLKPSHDIFDYHSLYALAAAFTGGLAIVLLRKLSTQDKPQTIMGSSAKSVGTRRFIEPAKLMI